MFLLFQAAPVSLINAFGVLLDRPDHQRVRSTRPYLRPKAFEKNALAVGKRSPHIPSAETPNGGKLNLRGKIMKRLLTAMLVLFFCTRHIESAHATDVEFIFSGQDVRAVGYTGGKVRPGEKINVAEIKQRFSGFAVTLNNECEGFCISIERNGVGIDVYYNSDNNRVERVVSWCQNGGLADTIGNTCGMGLYDANGNFFTEL